MAIYNIKPLLNEPSGITPGTPDVKPVDVSVTGKILIVSELPENGDLYTLYKLLDGTLWSWYYNKTTSKNEVKLNKYYNLEFKDISKESLLEFLESVREEILLLYNKGITPSEEYFGNYQCFINSETTMYSLPIPLDVYIEDSIYSLKAKCYLEYNVEDGKFKDSTNPDCLYTAKIRIEILDLEDGDVLFEFHYYFMNPLAKQYSKELDQVWLAVDENIVIVLEEQLDISHFRINNLWYNSLKDSYNYEVDLLKLNFLFVTGETTIVDKGYVKFSPDSVYDSELVFTVNSIEDLTKEYIKDNIDALRKAMYLVITKNSRVYTKSVGVSEPNTILPFTLPTFFTSNLVFTQPNLKTMSFNYIKINQTKYSIEYN